MNPVINRLGDEVRRCFVSEPFHLPNPPSVEAILDIECDIPAAPNLAELEAVARKQFGVRYPRFRQMFAQVHEISVTDEAIASSSTHRTLDALQFLQDDEKQVVQLRRQGYSFNRLAPYAGLDGLLPEIEQTWRSYRDLVSPLLVRKVRLRYINRILIPMQDGRVDLDEYLKCGPRTADEDRLTLVGFLNQYAAVDKDSGHRVETVLTSQHNDGNHVALIFDNSALSSELIEPEDWGAISRQIQSLRHLKNHVFQRTLTERCLSLFQ